MLFMAIARAKKGKCWGEKGRKNAGVKEGHVITVTYDQGGEGAMGGGGARVWLLANDRGGSGTQWQQKVAKALGRELEQHRKRRNKQTPIQT